MFVPDFAGGGASRVGAYSENGTASSFSRGWSGCFVIWKVEGKSFCSKAQ